MLTFTKYFMLYPMLSPIPNYYWKVHSDEERIKKLFKEINKLNCYVEYLSEVTETNTKEIELLKAEIEKLKGV